MGKPRVWFITGASRGLGAEFAKAALIAGHRVVATSRNADRVIKTLGTAESLLSLSLDVTSPQAVSEAVIAAAQRFGHIDVLVNNAGYGQLGAFEEVSDNLIQQQFATNVFGCFHVTRSILPLMRSLRSGHIITISSISGLVGCVGGSIYAATKHALEGWMESLHTELEPFGIQVTLIEPGSFNTGFPEARSVHYGDIEVAEYAEFSKQLKTDLATHRKKQMGDPAKLASALLKITEQRRAPMRFVAGSDCLAALLYKADIYRKDAEEWYELSVSTDHIH